MLSLIITTGAAHTTKHFVTFKQHRYLHSEANHACTLYLSLLTSRKMLWVCQPNKFNLYLKIRCIFVYWFSQCTASPPL